MHCRGGVFIPNAEVHRRGGGANRWTCADMGEGGSKISKNTADVLCEWPLTLFNVCGVAQTHIAPSPLTVLRNLYTAP